MEHSAVLLTCINIPHGFQAFVWSIFEWPLKTGFTVHLFWKESHRSHFVSVKISIKFLQQVSFCLLFLSTWLDINNLEDSQEVSSFLFYQKSITLSQKLSSAAVVVNGLIFG